MKQKPTYEELERKVRELEAKLSEEKVEWAILQCLALEWETAGPPGILDNRDLIARLDLAPDEALPALGRLLALGAIDKDARGYAAYLTPEGYDLAVHGRPDRPIAEQFGNPPPGVSH